MLYYIALFFILNNILLYYMWLYIYIQMTVYIYIYMHIDSVYIHIHSVDPSSFLGSTTGIWWLGASVPSQTVFGSIGIYSTGNQEKNIWPFFVDYQRLTIYSHSVVISCSTRLDHTGSSLHKFIIFLKSNLSKIITHIILYHNYPTYFKTHIVHFPIGCCPPVKRRLELQRCRLGNRAEERVGVRARAKPGPSTLFL